MSQSGGKKLKNKIYKNKNNYNNKFQTMEAKYSEHLSEPWFTLIGRVKNSGRTIE